MTRESAELLFEVINSREDVLRRLIRKCAYLKYVEGRLGERILYADEILRDGFCVNMIDTPLCPIKVVTNLQEAVWDADIVVAGLPSTEIRRVFKDIGRYWRERRTMPIIISLAKGVETALEPHPHILTPTQMIVDMSKFFLQFSILRCFDFIIGGSLKGCGLQQLHENDYGVFWRNVDFNFVCIYALYSLSCIDQFCGMFLC